MNKQMNWAQYKALRKVDRENQNLTQQTESWDAREPQRTDFCRQKRSQFTARPHDMEVNPPTFKRMPPKIAPILSGVRTVNSDSRNESHVADVDQNMTMHVSTEECGEQTGLPGHSSNQPQPTRLDHRAILLRKKNTVPPRMNIAMPGSTSQRPDTSFNQVDANVELAILNTIEDRLRRAEHDERVQMGRNLVTMQHYRRAFVYDALRENNGNRLPNLENLLNQTANPHMMSFIPPPCENAECLEHASEEPPPASMYEYNDEESELDSVAEHGQTFEY